MTRALLVLLVLTACAHPPVDPATRETIRQLEDVVAKQPDNAPYIYALAAYQDHAKRPAEVVRWLRRLEELGWDHGVSSFDFPNSSTRAFRDIAARLNAREPAVNHATVAFTIATDADLMPEGIAYDPDDDVFYVSSIARRKVVRVDRHGRAADFVSGGMFDGLGMKVDRARRRLWVISSSEKEKRSQLAAYDLHDGSVVTKVEATPALLNDLTLLEDGTVFATDMIRGNVMRLAPGAEMLEIFASDFTYPNGITNDGRVLYVADFRGVTRVDLTTRAKEPLQASALLNGIDGIDFHDGTLIGIQNAIGNARVIRVHLTDGNRVEILESRNPHFVIPTTGVIVGNQYWFVANSELRSTQPRAPVMLRLAL